MEGDKPDFLFKIVLTGNSGVGKTNFLSRFTQGVFDPSVKPTIGVEFASKTLEIDGKSIKSQIWDTSGQEQFKTITNDFFHGVSGAILFYDVTDPISFNSLPQWLHELRKDAVKNLVIILVGNKCDLEDKRKISTEKGVKFAKKEKLLFIEASALESINVNETFVYLFTEILKTIKSNEDVNHVENDKLEQKNVINVINSNKIENNEISNERHEYEKNVKENNSKKDNDNNVCNNNFKNNNHGECNSDNKNNKKDNDDNNDEKDDTGNNNDNDKNINNNPDNNDNNSPDNNDNNSPDNNDNNENDDVSSNSLYSKRSNYSGYLSQMIELRIEKGKIYNIIEYVRFLEAHLSNYEKVSSYDFQPLLDSIVKDDAKEAKEKDAKD
ncbi:hypothetical protein M9Y10_020784 [Tritrichomonas musculus]|uniref:Uncharacterized protein n=1 Tax=Tritrichomonas musculus TaxID=1915356 RepID=A0ABR2HEP7_9EUKA